MVSRSKSDFIQSWPNGVVFSFAYFGFTLVVNIGVFNLIMGIFLECVMTTSEARKKADLVEATTQMEARITDMVVDAFSAPSTDDNNGAQTDNGSGSRITDRLRQSRHFCPVEFHKLHCDSYRDATITVIKEAFDQWIKKPEVATLLDEIDVDSSSKTELFDAIDVSGSGYIDANDLIALLLKLRGPISKLDMVSARMKVSHNSKVLAQICDHFTITDD